MTVAFYVVGALRAFTFLYARNFFCQIGAKAFTMHGIFIDSCYQDVTKSLSGVIRKQPQIHGASLMTGRPHHVYTPHVRTYAHIK